MSQTLSLEQRRQSLPRRSNISWLTMLVLVASLGWYLVGIKDMALIDRDEPMIAEVARQMVHRHEWLTPHLPAWEEKSIFKPPLAMWLMGGSFKLLRVSELAARLPSAICSALTVTILFVAAGRRWGTAVGLVAAGGMALPLLPAIAGRMALTDPLLTLLATIALLCLEKSLRADGLKKSPEPVEAHLAPEHSMAANDAAMAPNLNSEPRTPNPQAAANTPTGSSGAASGILRNALMWIVLGLGMLIKGPAILAFFGPAVVMAADRFRWKPYLVFAAGMLLATLGGGLLLSNDPNANVNDLNLSQLDARQIAALVLGIVGGLIAAGSFVRWFFRALRLPIGVLWGAPLMLATCGWWFVYIRQAGEAVQQASARRFILFEVLTRIATPMEHHSGLPGYYLVVALVGLLPFSALLPRLLAWAFRNRKADSTLQLLLAWVVGSWILCEISATKLPHYILPAWPALALLAAMWWNQVSVVRTPTDRKRAFGIILPTLIFATVVGAVAVLAWQTGLRIWLGELIKDEHSELWPRIAFLARMPGWQVNSLLLAPILLLLASAAAWLLASRHSVRAGLLALAAGWAPALLVLVAALTSRTAFSDTLSRQAAEKAIELGQPGTHYLAMGYTEPALFFYLPAGQYERIDSPRQFQSLTKIKTPFVLIVSRPLEPAVRQWLGPRIADMRVANGINTARGRPEAACVFAIKGIHGNEVHE